MNEHRPLRTPSNDDSTVARGEVVVRLAGAIDLTNHASLVDLLASSEALERTDLVVDLRDVTFLDGASAGLLLQAAGSLAERACSLTVRSPQPIVRRALVLSGAQDAGIRISAPTRDNLALHS